jgi:hypothetical protein
MFDLLEKESYEREHHRYAVTAELEWRSKGRALRGDGTLLTEPFGADLRDCLFIPESVV